MHLLDHLTPRGGDDEPNGIARASERTDCRRAEIAGGIHRVALAQILESHREKGRHALLSRGDRELAQRSVMRAESPLGRIDANRDRSGVRRVRQRDPALAQ